MLTVRYDALGVRPGDRVLDLGCGFGRHAYESMRRGAEVVACDFSLAELKDVTAMFKAIAAEEAATLPAAASGAATNGDATRLPFADGAFDTTLSQLVVNFMRDARAGVREMARVTRPGGLVASCVWDYAGGMTLLRAFWDAARDVDPAAAALDEDRRRRPTR